jgi:hypothetical protein
MYRNLIYTVTAILIGGAAYYFHTAGVPGMITNGGDKRGNGVSAIEVFSGVYTCGATDGCETETKLVLQQDTTLDIISIVDNEQVSLGQGTWGIGKGGSLVFVINRSDGASPTSLIAKKVTHMKIEGFPTKKKLFPGMENPSFTRVREEVQSTVAN